MEERPFLGDTDRHLSRKVQYLMESTEDRAQRFNLKRRLEEVLGDRKELAIWNNTILKEVVALSPEDFRNHKVLTFMNNLLPRPISCIHSHKSAVASRLLK